MKRLLIKKCFECPCHASCCEYGAICQLDEKHRDVLAFDLQDTPGFPDFCPIVKNAGITLVKKR